MTNRAALLLGLAILALIGIDLALGLGGTLFLARRFIEGLERLAVWR
jgi:hypothetical protein